jgi:hypothetical protein
MEFTLTGDPPGTYAVTIRADSEEEFAHAAKHAAMTLWHLIHPNEMADKLAAFKD